MAHFYSALPVRIKDVPVAFRQVLSRLSDEFHICLEFQIRKDYDVVILHPRGIHVIEVKNELDAVTGGPMAVRWTITRRNGTVDERSNFYKQATDAADDLKNVLRRESSELLSSPCSNPRCTPNQICSAHRAFWSKCRFLPYVAIPNWNTRSQVVPDVWCRLVQGSAARQNPEYVIDAISRRNWDTHRDTRGLTLLPREIENIITKLPVARISREAALGEAPKWESGLDPRVVRALREQELMGLRHQLETEHIVAVIGEPKVGKTSIAKLLAIDLAAEGYQILDYDFRLHESRLGSLSAVMLEVFLERLNLPVQRVIQDNISVFLGALSKMRVCVILDNFEWSLDTELTIRDEGLSRLMDVLLAAASKLESYIIVTAISTFRTQNMNKLSEFRLSGVSHDIGVSYLSTTYGWSSAESEQIYDIRPGHPLAMHAASVELKQIMALGFVFHEAFARLSPDVAALMTCLVYFNQS